MSERMKPILQFICKTDSRFVSKRSLQALAEMANKYKDKYEVISTPEGFDVRATNTTVVQLTIDADMDLDKIKQILDYINQIPTVDKKLNGITEEKMQELIQDLDDSIYEFQALEGDNWDNEEE